MTALLTAVIPEGLQKPGGVSVTSTHLIIGVATLLAVAAILWLTARH